MFIDWSIGLEKLRAIDIPISADGVGAGAVLNGAADGQAVVALGGRAGIGFADIQPAGAGQIAPACFPGEHAVGLDLVQGHGHSDFCGAFIGSDVGDAGCVPPGKNDRRGAPSGGIIHGGEPAVVSGACADTQREHQDDNQKQRGNFGFHGNHPSFFVLIRESAGLLKNPFAL